MKVSFDAQLLLEAQKTGIGWMADRLLREMRRIDPKMDLQLNYFQLRDYKNGTPEALKEYLALGFRQKRAFCSYRLSNMLWTWLPYPYSPFFGKAPAFSFFFNYYIPPGVKGKPVTVFHDMGYKAFPETVRKRTMMMLNANMEKACRRAEKIITVSQFTKDETFGKRMDVRISGGSAKGSNVVVSSVVRTEICMDCEIDGCVRG